MKHTRLLLLCGLGFFAFGGISLAAVPNFSLSPASGTTLKMYCPTTINVQLTAGGAVNAYNAVQSTLQFDSANTQLTPGTVNAIFSDFQVNAIEAGNRYRFGGNFPSGASGSADVSVVNFWFRTTSAITSTQLQFVNIDGTTPIQYGRTDFGQWLIGVNQSANILTGVSGASYNFTPLPCVVDGNAPGVFNLVPSNGAQNVPTNQTISFLTYDWIGSNGHYWYQGLNTGILANYVAAPSTVDNQEWVDSSKIRVTVACATCAGAWSYILSGAALTVNSWAGDGTRNQWTWDSHYRGYTVSFPNPASYEVEKQVNVSISTTDNPNEIPATHTFTGNYSFNAPIAPTISRLLPSTSTFVNPLKSSPIKYYLADNRAGINTGSVLITIPQIMSGAQVLLTGYTYSGSDLTFVLSGGAAGLGNAGTYTVQFYPKWDFPANTGISINTVFTDLAGNTGIFNDSFTTRPDCSFFGCNEILSINILGGTNAGIVSFTGALLIVTGTNFNSPYPYLTGVNNDTIMCGTPWAGALLTGNVNITDTTGNVLNGTSYTGNKLYITGVNFTVVNGVITIQ